MKTSLKHFLAALTCLTAVCHLCPSLAHGQLKLPVSITNTESKVFGSARRVEQKVTISESGQLTAIIDMHNSQALAGFTCQILYLFKDINDIPVGIHKTPIYGIKHALFKSKGAFRNIIYQVDIPKEVLRRATTISISSYPSSKGTDTIDAVKDKALNVKSIGYGLIEF